MVKPQPSKLMMRVRFSSPAPNNFYKIIDKNLTFCYDIKVAVEKQREIKLKKLLTRTSVPWYDIKVVTEKRQQHEP